MKHLDENQIAAAVADLHLEPEASEHLGSCITCRNEVNSMLDLIELRREQMSGESPDWQLQKQSILSRLPVAATPIRRRFLPRPILALAATAALVFGIGALHLVGTGDEAINTAEISLEEILAETETLLDDDSIPGLWVADPVTDVDDFETLFDNPAS